MIILSRRLGETVVLELPTGEQIAVVLLEVKGSQARLAFDAQPTVSYCVRAPHGSTRR